jgi:hypothetical protein
VNDVIMLLSIFVVGLLAADGDAPESQKRTGLLASATTIQQLGLWQWRS